MNDGAKCLQTEGDNMKPLLIVCFSVSATHKETKQFFTLYNTLDDKKVYLEKEVSERSRKHEFCEHDESHLQTNVPNETKNMLSCL